MSWVGDNIIDPITGKSGQEAAERVAETQVQAAERAGTAQAEAITEAAAIQSEAAKEAARQQAEAAREVARLETEAARQAAELQARSAEQAIAEQRAGREQFVQRTDPFRQVGLAASVPLLQELGIQIPEGLAAQYGGAIPTAAPAPEQVKTPLYDFLMKESFEDIQESAAAQGRLRSGGTLQDLQARAAELASIEQQRAEQRQDVLKQQRFSNLFNLLGLGSNVATGQATAGLQSAGQIGGLLTQLGAAQAAGLTGAAGAAGRGIAGAAGAGAQGLLGAAGATGAGLTGAAGALGQAQLAAGQAQAQGILGAQQARQQGATDIMGLFGFGGGGGFSGAGGGGSSGILGMFV